MWATLALIALAALGLVATLRWIAHSESGTQWALSMLARQLPGFTVRDVHGALLGDFRVARLSLMAGTTRVTLRDLQWQGLRVHDWQWHAPYLTLQARSLSAAGVEVLPGPKPAEERPPSPAPRSLRLPVALRLQTLRIDQIGFAPQQPPLTDLLAQGITLGVEQRVDRFSARWSGVVAEGRLQLQGDAPLLLQARIDVRGPGVPAPEAPATPSAPAASTALARPAAPASAPAEPKPLAGAVAEWARHLDMVLTARGPLERFETELTLHMQQQQLAASAQVTPFAPTPVAQLNAKFEKLDLATLLAPVAVKAPTTALTGTALVSLADGGRPGAPMSISADIGNTESGPWDAKRLPLRRVMVRASGVGDRWTLAEAELEAAGADQRKAGRLTAQGSWNAGQLDLKTQLDGLLLDALDRRMAPLQLSGPVEVALQMPPPAPADAGAGRRDPQAAAAPAFRSARLKAQLAGAVSAPARANVPAALADQSVQLTLQAQATPTRYQLDVLQARAGAARLDAKGHAERRGEQWALDGGLTLQSFNPALWLPGPAEAGWRRARTQLNGDAALKFQLPAEAADTAALLRLAAGSLKVRLHDSIVADQPATLDLDAQADGAGRVDARSELQAAGNAARLEALLRVPAPGRSAALDDRLELHLDAPTLQRLAPLAQAFGIPGLQGSAQLDAEARGPLGGWIAAQAAAAAPAPANGNGAKAARGKPASTPPQKPAASTPPPPLPTIHTEGKVAVDGLRLGDLLALQRLQGRWNASTDTQAPMTAQLRAEQLQLKQLEVPSAELQGDGSSADHRFRLDAQLRPPAQQRAAAAASTGTDAGGGSASVGSPANPAPLVLAARLHGGLLSGAANASGWRGVLDELSLRPLEGGAAPATPAERLPLFVTRDVSLEWMRDDTGQRAALSPGQAEVLGAVLRWREARWQQDATRQELNLEADIEPFAVAPLLQRVQPDFGWVGDLKLGARVSVKAAPELTADIEIARAGGDLQINEYGIVQSLGLSDLRLRLQAAGGVWRFSELVAGSNLGRVAGEQTVRTAATQLWPEPQAPLDGQLQVQVDNLATWGGWVPAGWRLGGQLNGQVDLSGQFGAPNLTGALRGQRLTARNALQGVALSEGLVDIRFQGDTARIETFRFAAGDGTVELTGAARLGEQPQAQLRLIASRFALLTRVDRRVVVSGEAAVQLDQERIGVDGRFRTDEGLIDISRADAPAVSEDVVVRRPGDAPVDPDAQDPEGSNGAKPAAARALALDVVVNLGDRFRLRGRGIDTRIAGELRLTSPRGRLAAHGEIRAQDGKYEAYGQEMDIERGVFTFVGEIGNPRLDIVAVRPNLDVRVGVTVAGSALAPRVRLFSDPALPDTETLALLITGRSYDSLAGNQTLLLQRAALALLAGEGGGDDSIMKRLPLDEISVRQTEGAVPETVVTLGKQISERVYVGYERGLSAAAGSWQLIYRIAQRFTLRAQSGEDSAVDLVWLFRWN
ncbi:translocation/assembly module TamB domain-containing protein [Caldimonas brevitalea]|uniref:Translocation and assembly module TamB n=1 Tax=Caldimonas brevitalea TaxID=413882 RepID=A0A0G3BEY2_9BURK|nr:translocation/assembly module TamB domain-containing protein [Caldimonas brevitalea]AKJ27979.1 translocation and assembly module TamB [Caldimonas brevitalea]